MKHILRLMRQSLGGAVIEFALVMPVLIILFAGLYDFAYYILLHDKVTRTSGTIAFIVSKQDLRVSTLQSIMQNANVIIQPFDLRANGTIITSQIGFNTQGRMVINWQQRVGLDSSRVGVIGGEPAPLPNNLVITGSERLIVTEVFYNFTPSFLVGVLSPKKLYSISIFPPRIGQMDSLING